MDKKQLKFNMLVESILNETKGQLISAEKIECRPIYTMANHLICLIDGSTLRFKDVKKESVEFMGGGHHLVYDYVPKGKIWMEKNVVKENPAEGIFLLLHELIEFWLMKNKDQEYIPAHDFANRVEGMLREKFVKSDLKFINPEEVKKLLIQISEQDMDEDVDLEFREWFEVPIKAFLIGLSDSVDPLDKENGDHQPEQFKKLVNHR